MNLRLTYFLLTGFEPNEERDDIVSEWVVSNACEEVRSRPSEPE